MNHTSIEWSLNPDGSHGYTWNPITGCLNGCQYCYARKLANGRLRLKYLRNFEIALPHENPKIAFDNPFYPRFWPERMWLPELVGKKRKPKGIFVCDMSDLFGIGVPEQWTKRVLDVIAKFPRHRFYLLTKQPQNLARWSPFSDNCWVGVTATNYTEYLRATEIFCRFPRIKAKVKYLSIEPLLDWVKETDLLWLMHAGINQVIIGAQTHPTILPKFEWLEGIVEACRKAEVAYFLKNNLKPLLLDHCDDKRFVVDYVHGESEFDGLQLKLHQEVPQ